MDFIKKILNYEKDDSLIRDGIILFSATMIANFASYLYHFGMGRFLGPAEYGALGAILFPTATVLPVVVLFPVNNTIPPINKTARSTKVEYFHKSLFFTDILSELV